MSVHYGLLTSSTLQILKIRMIVHKILFLCGAMLCIGFFICLKSGADLGQIFK